MPPNDDAAKDADQQTDANHRGGVGVDVGEPREKKEMSVGEGRSEGVDATSEVLQAKGEGEGKTTTAAHPATEGGGGSTSSIVATAAAANATAKVDEQDRRRQQRDDHGVEDDEVTATWSLDSDGRPVSMPHSWHPSAVHEGGGGGGGGRGASFGNYSRGGGGGGVVGGEGGATIMTMPRCGVPPPVSLYSHSRRGAHASSAHHPFRPVRSVADGRHRQPPPPPPPRYHGGGHHRQDQQHPLQYAAQEDYPYHGGHRSASSVVVPQSIRHAPPPHPQEHGRYPSHVGVGRAPLPHFMDRRPLHGQQQQPQRDYRADHPSGGGGGIRGVGGGLYYPQEEQQQQQPHHHVRRTDDYHRSPTESPYPPSNQSNIQHPSMTHRPSTHQVATTPSSSSQLRMLHHPPYHPQMLSMNVGNVVGGGDNSNNNPLLSTRQRNPSQKGCSCRKTRCLKLYCQCFAASVLCSAHQCICDGCQNIEGEALKGNRGAIAIARRQVLVRNPNAFENKFFWGDVRGNGIAGAGSVADTNAFAPDAAVNASMATIYRPPPLRHNGSVDSGHLMRHTQVGYGGVVDGNDVQRGCSDYDVPVLQQQQHLGRLVPPPPPPTGLPHVEFQFRSLDCPSTSSLRAVDLVDETVEEIKASVGCEDKEVRGPSEEGLGGDDAGAVAVDTSTSTETNKIDEEKEVDDKRGEEKAPSSKCDTSKSSQAASSSILQEVDDVEIDDRQKDRTEKDTRVTSQIVDAQIVVEIERDVDEEEREQPENDNFMGASSSSISTSKSLEPSSTCSFSKPSFEINNAWYRRGQENDLPHSRSWDVDRRQRDSSYNTEYEGRNAEVEHRRITSSYRINYKRRVSTWKVKEGMPIRTCSKCKSPGRSLHMVSSEEDKASIAQHPTSMPSLDATLDDDQHSKEGSSKNQEVKTDPLAATADMPRRTSDNGMKLDFLATLATSALDTLNADAVNAASMREKSTEEGRHIVNGKECERMDQQEATLKRHRSSSDGKDPRKRYMSEQQEQQRHHYEQKLHQYQAPQTHHYDQYVRHHPQYEQPSNKDTHERAEHAEFGFGNKCHFTTCGRCGADKEQHKNPNGTCIMGVYCTLTEEDGAKKGASDKYDAILADLAARAESRARMTIALERFKAD
ncbi:hypothetical protein ACHAXA_002048 [Cyclostephanos tholiformis]|uniref:CRC domain-containing protein n=1 Tax=Cyclostephanos tholiformis TaxID=382380 RepID=A0ABD3ST22_9STRA